MNPILTQDTAAFHRAYVRPELALLDGETTWKVLLACLATLVLVKPVL